MKHKLLALLAVLAAMSATPMAYAETPKASVEVDPVHIVTVLGIGLGGAVVTSLEGKIRSGGKFDGGKFFVAVKRTAAISIPSTFAMIAFNPDPTTMDYVIVGLAVILGAKMMHAKKPSVGTTTTQTDSSGSVTVETSVIQTTIQKAPPLGPEGNWYQTNFIADRQRGNVLPYGTDLWVKVPGARSYVSAILTDSSGNKIQIDQSHPADEDKNVETARLEMKQRDGSPMPRGEYTLQIQSDVGSGDGQGIKSDKFTIY